MVDVLQSLVAKNLVVRESDGSDDSRFTMLETIRAFRNQAIGSRGSIAKWKISVLPCTRPLPVGDARLLGLSLVVLALVSGPNERRRLLLDALSV